MWRELGGRWRVVGLVDGNIVRLLSVMLAGTKVQLE